MFAMALRNCLVRLKYEIIYCSIIFGSSRMQARCKLPLSPAQYFRPSCPYDWIKGNNLGLDREFSSCKSFHRHTNPPTVFTLIPINRNLATKTRSLFSWLFSSPLSPSLLFPQEVHLIGGDWKLLKYVWSNKQTFDQMTPVTHRQSMLMLGATFIRPLRIFGEAQALLFCVQPIPYCKNYDEMGQQAVHFLLLFFAYICRGIQCNTQFSYILVYVTRSKEYK